MKLALKICIKQGQVIIYRDFTTRKGTFLFKESFQACFNPCYVQNIEPRWGMLSYFDQIFIAKQSTQVSFFRSLGVKLALKICIKQGQVIIYRDFTTRKGTFLFKESFQACFNPCYVQNIGPRWGMLSYFDQIFIAKHSTQVSFFRSLGVKLALKICIKQGQVIIYRNFTTRKGTFLFKESFQACFNPC